MASLSLARIGDVVAKMIDAEAVQKLPLNEMFRDLGESRRYDDYFSTARFARMRRKMPWHLFRAKFDEGQRDAQQGMTLMRNK